MPAALARIMAEIRLIPAMSTTEYIIVTSVEPTYELVSPEATVETISFGTPTGSRRIASVASAVPPVPPSAPIASNRPSACSRDTISAAPRPIASIAAARSPAAASTCTSAPAAAATSWRVTSGSVSGSPRIPRVDEQHIHAARRDPVAQKRVLAALRVQRPDRTTVGRRSRASLVAAPLRLAVGASIQTGQA